MNKKRMTQIDENFSFLERLIFWQDIVMDQESKTSAINKDKVIRRMSQSVDKKD